MTDNQERAYAELTKFQWLQSEIRILELKYESALDEAGIGSQWPPVEIVPASSKESSQRSIHKRIRS